MRIGLIGAGAIVRRHVAVLAELEGVEIAAVCDTDLERASQLAPGAAVISDWASTLTLESIDDGLDWSPYEGMRVPGSVRHVVAGGSHVVADGSFTGDAHRGEYLPVSRVLEPA